MRAVNKRKPTGPNSPAQFWQRPSFCKSTSQQGDSARALTCLWNTREGHPGSVLTPTTERNKEDTLCHPWYNTATLFNCCSADTGSAILLQKSCWAAGTSSAELSSGPAPGSRGNCGHQESDCWGLNTCIVLRQVAPGCSTWHMEAPPLELSRFHTQLEPDSSINTE